jgi:hypothetical protein
LLERIYSSKDMVKAGVNKLQLYVLYRGADKSLARPGRKQATETEDFDFHIAYL